MGIALRLVDFYLFWRLWVVVDFVVEGGKKGLDVGRDWSREGKEGGGSLGCVFGGRFSTPVGLGNVDGRAQEDRRGRSPTRRDTRTGEHGSKRGGGRREDWRRCIGGHTYERLEGGKVIGGVERCEERVVVERIKCWGLFEVLRPFGRGARGRWE